MTYYYIYKITNMINGNMYIGKHKTHDLEHDHYMGSGKIIKLAERKYGLENFKKEIQGFYESEEELNYMERVFVDEEWIAREDTYNIRLGGDGPTGVKAWNKGKHLSKEQCEKISRKLKGINLGVPKSEETKAKMRAAFKANGGSNFAGKHHTDEAKRKIGEASKNRQVSEETRRKQSKSLKGKPFTESHLNAVRKAANARKGVKVWTNGIIEKHSRECPGPDFVRGHKHNFKKEINHVN